MEYNSVCLPRKLRNREREKKKDFLESFTVFLFDVVWLVGNQKVKFS